MKQKETLEKQFLENFEKQCIKMKGLGYTQKEKTISIAKASNWILITTMPIVLVTFLLFFFLAKNVKVSFNPIFFLIAFIAIVLSVIIHELLHGLAWSIFCKNGFKSIRFGIMMDSFTPYCNCKETLQSNGYIIGGIAPLIVLGIIPAIAAIVLSNLPLLLFSAFNIIAAGGDIIIVAMALKNRNTLIIDHPSECGFVTFIK